MNLYQMSYMQWIWICDNKFLGQPTNLWITWTNFYNVSWGVHGSFLSVSPTSGDWEMRRLSEKAEYWDA